jgi:superfamily I DNA and RNA helicase
LSGVLGYNYIYKEHRNISFEKAEFHLTSKDLIEDYQLNVDKATTKYLNKVVQISGKITDVENDNFTIDDVIVCYSDSVTIQSLKINITVTMKGRNIGYDELLENIKLDQSSIIEK